ncbi:hypothetical protein PDESU_00186 [Pontiella desulfatans]|uniref:DUF86 domain-containing protein n=1 Tax=Pontiella desulfatans TaxID=2750659 RepID=A0A6C2TWD6_PONDE|nr:HepT-like ribonuclease domain-containing protein [Pontiella desulfatans]VGO11641.1 hypothetical protein PDESU_00186 [Pontiella desulfatans]
MSDPKLVLEILAQIEGAALRVERRFSKVDSADVFLDSEEGLERLDAICMQLIAIGESLKNLDKVTGRELLPMYPEVEWKGAMGIRDIITHHYFDLDAEAVFDACESDIPVLVKTIQRMRKDLEE